MKVNHRNRIKLLLRRSSASSSCLGIRSQLNASSLENPRLSCFRSSGAAFALRGKSNSSPPKQISPRHFENCRLVTTSSLKLETVFVWEIRKFLYLFGIPVTLNYFRTRWQTVFAFKGGCQVMPLTLRFGVSMHRNGIQLHPRKASKTAATTLDDPKGAPQKKKNAELKTCSTQVTTAATQPSTS